MTSGTLSHSTNEIIFITIQHAPIEYYCFRCNYEAINSEIIVGILLWQIVGTDPSENLENQQRTDAAYGTCGKYLHMLYICICCVFTCEVTQYAHSIGFYAIQ